MNPQQLLLWADDDLLAVNKPAGLPVGRGGWAQTDCLIEIVGDAFGPLWTVHRLDRGTSGVILFARNAAAHRDLNTQFQERTIVKTYHALVLGDPPWQETTVQLALRADGDRRHRTVVDGERGKPATTQLRVLERFGRHTLVEARPHTGRTHQIRTHLSSLGLPVVCDKLYGGGSHLLLSAIAPPDRQAKSTDHSILERTALHALTLVVRHPHTGDRLDFGAPYPDDLAEAFRQLRSRQ